MKKKEIIQIGLKDITKTDLEIKKSTLQGDTHHVLSEPNYELGKSKLLTTMLHFGLQEIDIPFSGPKNSIFEAIMTRRLASSERVADVLKSLVSQLTRLYHTSTVERAQYVNIAMKQITSEVSLPKAQAQELREAITFILTDGISKTFRDNVGRQIPIPEAAAMSNLVTSMIKRMSTVLSTGKSIIDTKSLVSLLKDYAIVERRAFLSNSEVDKRFIFEELSDITEKASKDAMLCLLVKNRLEYTINAASPTIRMSTAKYSELINTPVLKLEAVAADGPVKVMKFGSPLVSGNDALDELENVSLAGIIMYIDEVMGAVSSQRATSDLVNTIFKPGAIVDSIISNQHYDKQTVQTARELHMLLFKMELIKMSAQSFTTIPPYNSTALSKITQSINAKLDIYTIEPFVIALDNIKHAYISSFKETLMMLRTGLMVPTEGELNDFKKRSETSPVYKYLYTNEHDALYSNSIKDAITAFENRKTSLSGLTTLTDSAWKIGRIVKRESEGTNLVMRGILYEVDSHIEESIKDFADDGTMSDEELIAVLSGKSGSFMNSTYQVFKYSFGSLDLDTLFSVTSESQYQELQEIAARYGVMGETDGKPEMFDSSASEVNAMLKKKLGKNEDKFWAIRMSLYAIFIPEVKYKLTSTNPFTDGRKTSIVNSPFLNVKTTAVRSQDVDRTVCSFVKDNAVHSVLATTWPAMSTRISLVADLSKHKLLAALMPDEKDRASLLERFNSNGVATLDPVKNLDLKKTELIDFRKFFEVKPDAGK